MEKISTAAAVIMISHGGSSIRACVANTVSKICCCLTDIIVMLPHARNMNLIGVGRATNKELIRRDSVKMLFSQKQVYL